MYSFIVMGAATVYEWDLLFPDLLDVFILSVLPIDRRRLFFARVLALAIFLGLVLAGTSALGIIFFSIFTEQRPILLHYLAHATAVLASGAFAATTFLAVQGILLNTVGENIFRRITPILQGASVLLLLTILLLTPTITHSLQPLLNSSSPAIRYFPPFWFLGIYERILAGPGALPLFHQLARQRLHRDFSSHLRSRCSLTHSPIDAESANLSKAAPQSAPEGTKPNSSTASCTSPSCASPPNEPSSTSSARPSSAHKSSASCSPCT